jgi:hypothetical protein
MVQIVSQKLYANLKYEVLYGLGKVGNQQLPQLKPHFQLGRGGLQHDPRQSVHVRAKLLCQPRTSVRGSGFSNPRERLA